MARAHGARGRGVLVAASILVVTGFAAYVAGFALVARSLTPWDMLTGGTAALVALFAAAWVMMTSRLTPISVFAVSWYTFLALSRYRLAALQVDFGPMEFILLAGCPAAFPLGVAIGGRLPAVLPQTRALVDSERVRWIVMLLYAAATATIFRLRGSLLLTGDWGNERFAYPVPFLSMAQEGLGYLLIALIFNPWRKSSWLSVGLLMLSATAAFYSRGNVFRLLAIILAALVLRDPGGLRRLLGRNAFKVVALGMGLAWLFAFMGNARYAEGLDIVAYTQTRTGNAAVAWLNTYFCTPFDLAAVAIRTRRAVGYPFAFLDPVLNFLQFDGLGTDLLARYEAVTWRGINSVGGLAPFIRDFAAFFWVEFAFFGLLVGYIWKLARRTEQYGVQGVVIAFTFMLFFDAGLLRMQVLLPVVMAILLRRLTFDAARRGSLQGVARHPTPP